MSETTTAERPQTVNGDVPAWAAVLSAAEMEEQHGKIVAATCMLRRTAADIKTVIEVNDIDLSPAGKEDRDTMDLVLNTLHQAGVRIKTVRKFIKYRIREGKPRFGFSPRKCLDIISDVEWFASAVDDCYECIHRLALRVRTSPHEHLHWLDEADGSIASLRAQAHSLTAHTKRCFTKR